MDDEPAPESTAQDPIIAVYLVRITLRGVSIDKPPTNAEVRDAVGAMPLLDGYGVGVHSERVDK